MIVRKSSAELEKMRAAGSLAARTLQYALSLAQPGVTTNYIDTKADTFIRDHGATPAPFKYGKTDSRPAFPKSICTSVNEVVCHGIPGKQVLKDGDLICIDVTVILDGFHGDTCSTVPVGEVDEASRQLMRVTLTSLRKGIAAATANARLRDVGDAIQTYAEGLGYGVVEDFVGHGIGRKFHEDPQVSHVARRRSDGEGRISNPRLRPGMTFTIEPMVNEGSWETETLEDGWTAVTVDGTRSAQYEHTIAVQKSGPPEILTLLPGAATDAPAGFEP